MKALDRIVALLSKNISCLLVGAPGTAKTGMIRAGAEAAGFDETIIFRTSLAERVDLGGCYVADLAAGVTKALPLELLTKLRTTKKKTLLFLDDLGQAPMDVQASCMSLWDSGHLSPSVLIWGATNRPGDKAGVSALCEPLRSRFKVAFEMPTSETKEEATGPTFLCTWQEFVDGWCEWACDHGFAPEIVAWHRSTHGRTLHQWKPSANPALRMADCRSWQTLGELWNADLRDLHSCGAAVGKSVACEFLAFASMASELPTPQQVWMDPHGAPVPTEAAAQYLISAMLSRALEPKFAVAFVTYIDRLPRIPSAYAGRDAYRRIGPKLMGSKGWQEWFVKNEELFATSR